MIKIFMVELNNSIFCHSERITGPKLPGGVDRTVHAVSSLRAEHAEESYPRWIPKIPRRWRSVGMTEVPLGVLGALGG